METKKYWVIAVALVFGFVVGRWSTDKSPATAKAQTEKTEKVEKVERVEIARTARVERTNVTVRQLQDVLEKGRKLTGLQRQEALRNYLNKQVQWKGILKSAYCSDGQISAVISHRIKPSWLLGRRQVQVIVNFPDSQKETLLKAQKGSLVTYQGTLSEYTGSAKRPWLLTDGRILSVEVAKPKVRTKKPATKGR